MQQTTLCCTVKSVVQGPPGPPAAAISSSWPARTGTRWPSTGSRSGLVLGVWTARTSWPRDGIPGAIRGCVWRASASRAVSGEVTTAKWFSSREETRTKIRSGQNRDPSANGRPFRAPKTLVSHVGFWPITHCHSGYGGQSCRALHLVYCTRVKFTHWLARRRCFLSSRSQALSSAV